MTSKTPTDINKNNLIINQDTDSDEKPKKKCEPDAQPVVASSC